MAILSSGCTGAVAIVLLLHLAARTSAELEILPPGDIQSKSSGSLLVLTCKPKVDNVNLITNMEWRDPYDRVISSSKSNNQGIDSSDMFTEYENGNLQLTFNPLKAEQAGRYVCSASYANTEHFNKSVKVDIIDPISFTNAPEWQYGILGEEFTIKCQVTARPAPQIKWYRDGVPIVTSDADQYIVETNGLKILKVKQSDAGVYRCRALVVETGALDNRMIHLEVHDKPRIDEFKSVIEIIEGNNENVICSAHGIPPPKISWVKTISKENLTNSDRFGVDSTRGILTITNVQSTDSGEYECIAENAAGIANTNVIINVIEKPKIMDFLNRTVAQGKEVEITCKAFGRPAPDVVFKKQGAQSEFVKGVQPEDDRIILNSMTDNAKGETVASLNIQNALRRDDGIYECIATNKVAKAFKNGHLTVEFPPTFASLSNRTEWTWDSRAVNLSCIAESLPNATIRWRHNDRDIGKTELNSDAYKQHGNGPISILTVVPYDRRYYGDYKCIANNIHGEAFHIFRLREAPRPGAVEQVTISEITATTVTFNIILPPTEEDLPIDLVMVQWKIQDYTDWKDAQNKSWSPNSFYALENLEPATYYEFRFRVKNCAGEGVWSKSYLETTKARSEPAQPKIIKKSENAEYDTSPFSYQYNIQWIKPQDNGDMILQSIIRYCKIIRNKDSNDWEVEKSTCNTKVAPAASASAWLESLSPDTFYRAEVTVRNSLGQSKPGVVQFLTAKASSTVPMMKNRDSTSSLALIGGVVAAVFIIFIVIDFVCCCFFKIGMISYLCERTKRKPVDEDDAKLGREEKEPLREEKRITPIIDTGLRRETSITFDGKRSVSKTGFVGKDSAV